MSNEIDIQLQNSQAFGQLQSGFTAIEKNMASIVVTLDQIVKASKHAEDAQKKAAEGPLDSIKKARDAVRAYQKQVEEAGKGTPQLATAIARLADARAELTRQERTASLTMNTTIGRVVQYNALGTAVSTVSGNLKEMYQIARSAAEAAGMKNIAMGADSLNKSLQTTVTLQKQVKQSQDTTASSSGVKSMEVATDSLNQSLKETIDLQKQAKQASDKLSASGGTQGITSGVDALNKSLQDTIDLEQKAKQEHDQLVASASKSINVGIVTKEAVSTGRELQSVTENTSSAIRSQEVVRKEVLNIAKEELSIQQQIVRAINDQQAAFKSRGGRGNMSIAGLRNQLQGVSGGDFDAAFRELIASEVLQAKVASKKNTGAAGNFTDGGREFSQVSIGDQEKFQSAMRAMAAKELQDVPNRQGMTTRELYEATRSARESRRSMQTQFYNDSLGQNGGGFLYHTLIKEAEADRRKVSDDLRRDITQRLTSGRKDELTANLQGIENQLNDPSTPKSKRGSLFKKKYAIERELNKNDEEYRKFVEEQNAPKKGSPDYFRARIREKEDKLGRETDEDARNRLRRSIERNKEFLNRAENAPRRRDGMERSLRTINDQLGASGLSADARKSLYDRKYQLERRMRRDEERYQKYVDRQEAAPKGSPDYYRRQIQLKEEQLGRESDKSVRNKLSESIDKNRRLLQKSETGPGRREQMELSLADIDNRLSQPGVTAAQRRRLFQRKHSLEQRMSRDSERYQQFVEQQNAPPVGSIDHHRRLIRASEEQLNRETDPVLREATRLRVESERDVLRNLENPPSPSEQRRRDIQGIDEQLDNPALTPPMRQGLFARKHALEQQIQNEQRAYQRFVEQQNAPPVGSPDSFRDVIRHNEELMGRESDPAVRERMRRSIDGYRNQLRDAESPPGRMDLLRRSLGDIDAEIDRPGVAGSRKAHLYHQKYVLEEQIREESEQYKRFVAAQNAAPAGSPDYFRETIRRREERMSRESDPAVRERLRESIVRNRERLQNAESPVTANSPAFFDQERRKLQEQRASIPAGDSGAMKKNAQDLRDLEMQARRTEQEYRTLNATMTASASAGTANEYEEKISALKTLQSTTAGNSSEYRRLGAEIKQTERELATFKGEIVSTSGSADKLETDIKQLQDSINKLQPNTPEWKRLNDELFTTKRRLDDVNKQTKQYQSMQGKGWFGRTFMTQVGGAGGTGPGAGFAGTAVGQIKTLAATYLGLYEGINAVMREMEHGKEVLRSQYDTGIVGQQELVRQTPNIGTEDIGNMAKWAQESQKELMTSQENILNLAGFTKSMGVTDPEGMKQMTSLALKATRGDVETARGLQQLASVLLKTQGSNNYKGALGQARQMAEVSAGVVESIFNANISDRLVTMSIASQNQKIDGLSVEQIMEFIGTGSRTFSDQSGDNMSRAVLVGIDKLIDFKPQKSYKGARVPDEVMAAYKAAGSVQERYDVVSQSKELGFQFAERMAAAQGPLAGMIDKMFTSSEFRKNLLETQKLVTPLEEAGQFLDEQTQELQKNTEVLGIVNSTLMGLQEVRTSPKGIASGATQKLMDDVSKIDLAGVDFMATAQGALAENLARKEMLSSGMPYNEAMLKLQNVQTIIRQQKSKGMPEDSAAMMQLREIENGLAELADKITQVMTPAEKELREINAKLTPYDTKRALAPGQMEQNRQRREEIQELRKRRDVLLTPEGQAEFNRDAKMKDNIRGVFRDEVNGGGAVGGKAMPKGVINIQGGGGGLFSVPAEVLRKAAMPSKKTDFLGEVQAAASALKQEREASGRAAFPKSNRFVENGALRAHMATGKVGDIFSGLPANGSSLQAAGMAGNLRAKMGEIEPGLMGAAMRQANGYNGFVAAMNDPNRLTPAEKERIAKAAAERIVNGGAAADPTNLGKRFGKGSPIAVDSAFVQTGKTWWEREQSAQAAGNVRLDMAMPEGSARAVRAAKAKMEAKRLGLVPVEEPLTKKQLATPEGRAEQKARELRAQRIKDLGLENSIVDSAKAASNQVSGNLNGGQDRFRGLLKEAVDDAKAWEAMSSPEAKDLVGAIADKRSPDPKMPFGEVVVPKKKKVESESMHPPMEQVKEAAPPMESVPVPDPNVPNTNWREAVNASRMFRSSEAAPNSEGNDWWNAKAFYGKNVQSDGLETGIALNEEALRRIEADANDGLDDLIKKRDAAEQKLDEGKAKLDKIKNEGMSHREDKKMYKSANPFSWFTGGASKFMEHDRKEKEQMQKYEELLPAVKADLGTWQNLESEVRQKQRQKAATTNDAVMPQSSVDPEMKDILKQLAVALMAFENKSKGVAVPEVRTARIPTPRQPVATSVS
jgi:hypothetical protein